MKNIALFLIILTALSCKELQLPSQKEDFCCCDVDMSSVEITSCLLVYPINVDSAIEKTKQLLRTDKPEQCVCFVGLNLQNFRECAQWSFRFGKEYFTLNKTDVTIGSDSYWSAFGKIDDDPSYSCCFTITDYNFVGGIIFTKNGMYMIETINGNHNEYAIYMIDHSNMGED